MIAINRIATIDITTISQTLSSQEIAQKTVCEGENMQINSVRRHNLIFFTIADVTVK